MSCSKYIHKLQWSWYLSLSWSKYGGVSWFWHFPTSDFHETFTRSSLALNMSRKLLLDPYLAIHGKIMAKNVPFFMEFWPIFDIFHWLRPYLCSKRGYLGFHKQATHRRHDDEPFFTLGSTVHDWGWPKNGPFWTKKGQTWQACQHSKVVQKGPKGTKMINLSVFYH